MVDSMEFISKNRLKSIEGNLKKRGLSADFIIDGLTLEKMIMEINIRRSKARKNNKIMAAMRKKLELQKAMNNDQHD